MVIQRIVVALAIASLVGCKPAGSHALLASNTDSYPIVLLGSGKRWQVGYPLVKHQPVRFVDSGDGDIRVPSAQCIELIFKSEDYIYTFAVPECGIKEVAVPDIEFRTTFRAPRCGQFELFSAPMCGDSHSSIQNRFVVQSQERFIEWLKSESNGQSM